VKNKYRWMPELECQTRNEFDFFPGRIRDKRKPSPELVAETSPYELLENGMALIFYRGQEIIPMAGGATLREKSSPNDRVVAL